jgi:phospholipid/cholesterol/gamma-HCH transport system substrate-binding protein
MSTTTTIRVTRRVSLAALAVAAIALAAILLSGGSSYALRAEFANASGLVAGDSVELAGRSVGSITDIGVSPDGHADVTLSINDPSITPLHRGTRATIRALGQAGLTNRYVALSPGPASAPALPGSAKLPTTQTSSLVNYDAILDSFGSTQRANLQQLITESANVYAGSGSRYFTKMLSAFDPALSQLNRFTGQLADDRSAIASVIRTGAIAANAIASRRSDLMSAVANTATTLDALARQRRALSDSLLRAPAVLGQARQTLADAGAALIALRPALAEIPRAAGPLAGFLQRVPATLPAATPVVAQLRSELPDLHSTLLALEPLAPIAVKALNSAANALQVARPITRVFRYYGSDLLLGVFQGLTGVATANYDRWGHYARLEFTQPYQTVLGGPLTGLLSNPLAPNLFNLRSGLTRRCPGGNAPPAPDGSNPWVLSSSICTAENDVPVSVNFP